MSSGNIIPSLSQYIARTLKMKRLTLMAVEERAHGEISKSYISDLVSGRAHSPTVRKLQALAAGLGVPEDELFAAARGREVDGAFHESDFAALFDRYRVLSNDDKREVRPLLDMIENEIDWRRRRADVLQTV